MKYNKWLGIYIILCWFMSCTKGFQQENTNPNAVTNVPPSWLLPGVLLSPMLSDPFAQWNANINNLEAYMQHLTPNGFIQDGNYNNQPKVSSYAWWYASSAAMTQINVLSANNPQYKNYIYIVMILKAYTGQNTTDLFGDVPYTQAGLAYSNGLYYPVYDKQQDIYDSILNQLNIAAIGLNSNVELGGDISTNNGNVQAWKITAYQLMLRVAMRLVRIDPATAKKWALVAYNGLVANNGVSDNYKNSFGVTGNNLFVNPHSYVLGYPNNQGINIQGYNAPTKIPQVKLAATYINYLKKGNGLSGNAYLGDPRLFIIPVITDANGNQRPTPGNYGDTALIKGLSNTDPQVASYDINALYSFAQIRNELLTAGSTYLYITNAQTQFLLAEAAERGWISTNAATLFSYGVSSAIQETNWFNINYQTYLPNEYLLNYVTSVTNYYNSLSTNQRIDLINTEYWLASFLDGYESYNNWRRTRTGSANYGGIGDNPNGSPALFPPQGYAIITNGKELPSRMPYVRDIQYNSANYLQAVQLLSPAVDNVNSRIWWDNKDKNFFNPSN